MNYELLFKLEIRTNQELSRKVVELKQALGSALTMNTKVVELLKKFESRVNELEAQVVVKDKELSELKQMNTLLSVPGSGYHKYV